ncbi:MAG: hypothetical protein ACOYYU_05380 [Chloroflexota bacterium]
MRIKTKRKPISQSTPSLPGLKPGIQMKGGVRYDPAVHGFVAIVHTWDNVGCIGEPQEWRATQVFSSEAEAMHYYKTNIRPALEQLTSQMAKSSKGAIYRKLE